MMAGVGRLAPFTRRRASEVAGHFEGWTQYHHSPGAVHRRIEPCVVSPPGAAGLIPAVATCQSREWTSYSVTRTS